MRAIHVPVSSCASSLTRDLGFTRIRITNDESPCAELGDVFDMRMFQALTPP